LWTVIFSVLHFISIFHKHIFIFGFEDLGYIELTITNEKNKIKLKGLWRGDFSVGVMGLNMDHGPKYGPMSEPNMTQRRALVDQGLGQGPRHPAGLETGSVWTVPVA
jgi:hypothetical protein